MSYDRYKYATLVKDGDAYWLSPQPYPIDTSIRGDDRSHIVMEGDRLDLLAHVFFGDARLWWVIAEYNDLFWIFDLSEGQRLRLPSFDHLSMDLLI